MNIGAYLKENNVIINEKILKQDSDFNPLKQIELIVKIHKILSNKDNTIIPRISSSIGKELEGFKIQIRKVKKSIDIIEINKSSDDIDIYFRDSAIEIVKSALSCIECIEGEEYFSLIKRSMKNYELCLGRVDEGNLIMKENGDISIRTTKYMSYNLLEEDLFKYIKKLKRKKLNIDIDNMINKFILNSNLGQESIVYLKNLELYPLETMKVLSKYKNLKEDNFIERVKEAKKIDYREF